MHDAALAAAATREAAGDVAGAQALLEAVAAPDAAVLAALGALHRRAGRLSIALPLFDRAIAATPGYAPAWLERAHAFHSGGAFEAAAENYHRAAKLDPASVEATAGFATVALRLGYPIAARQWGERALELDTHDLAATVAVSGADIEEGKPASAIPRLRRALARRGDPALRIPALHLLGDALARTGDGDAAFTAYAKAKAEFAALHPTAASGHAGFVAGLASAFAAIASARWTAGSDTTPGRAGRHVFLIGYPRSGTTLVENVLASLPGVAALEEQPTLRDADSAFLTEDGLAKLADAGEADLADYRAAYWRQVAACGAEPAATFVDMDPLKGVRLPLIARLFPQARIVVMRRDPRDVVWSCFRSNFAPNPAVAEYITLERTARHYAAMMAMQEAFLARLPLAVHQLRYEALIADFDGTTRALCTFLGLDWTPAVRSFDKTARARGTSTASATQVRRPLYDGSGQWHAHAARFDAAMPVLQPWIDRFGYK